MTSSKMVDEITPILDFTQNYKLSKQLKLKAFYARDVEYCTIKLRFCLFGILYIFCTQKGKKTHFHSKMTCPHGTKDVYFYQTLPKCV